MIRGLLIALSVLLAGCVSSSSGLPGISPSESNAGRFAGAASRAQLYASVSTAAHYPSVERYRLLHGVPAANPDRVYSGYGGLMAVDGTGALYVVGGNGLIVDAFPAGSTKPKREIEIPYVAKRCKFGSGGTQAISALAADATGHLFLGIYTYAEDRAHMRRHDVPPAPQTKGWPCEGVAIYAPGAEGKALPIQVIRYSIPSDVIGLAVDAADNLYVAVNQAEVDEYTNAINDPTKSRVFKSTYTGQIHSIATDERGDLFIASTGASYELGRIERYSPAAGGSGAPSSQITLSAGVHLLPALAAHARVIYLDDKYSSVDLYHAFKNGSQSPFYSLPAQNVSSLAIGP